MNKKVTKGTNENGIEETNASIPLGVICMAFCMYVRKKFLKYILLHQQHNAL